MDLQLGLGVKHGNLAMSDITNKKVYHLVHVVIHGEALSDNSQLACRALHA